MLDGTYNGQPTTIQYIAKEDGSMVLTHSMQIRNETQGTWYDAFVDAHSGELVHVTDFVAKASVSRASKNRCFQDLTSFTQYLVLPIQKQVLTQGFEILKDPFDSFSSPLGWHSDGKLNYTWV